MTARRWRQAFAVTGAILVIALGIVSSQLPAAGAGGLLHPSRRRLTEPRPPACRDATSPMAHPSLMVYSERPGCAGASDPIYRRSAHPYYRVDMKGTRHLEFSDMVFWGGPLRERRVLGTLAAARAAELTALIVRQYFDQELLGRRSALLSRVAVPPELTVRTVAPAP
jgi:hypothetical protein